MYQAVSVAVQRVVAFNALEYRYTTLPKGRRGGGPQVAAQAAAEGGADWDEDEVPQPAGQGAAVAGEAGAEAVVPAPAAMFDEDQDHHEDVDMLGVPVGGDQVPAVAVRSEEHTSELQSLVVISYAVFCLDRKSVV